METIESVLNQQKKSGYADKMLSLVTDVRGFTQDGTLEQMVLNETLQGMSQTLKRIESQISKSTESIISQMKKYQENESEIKSVTPEVLEPEEQYDYFSKGMTTVIEDTAITVSDDSIKLLTESTTKALVPVVSNLPEVFKKATAELVEYQQETVGALDRFKDTSFMIRVHDELMYDQVKGLSDMIRINQNDSDESVAKDMEIVRLSGEDTVYYLREQSRFLESILGKLNEKPKTPPNEKPKDKPEKKEGLFDGLGDWLLGISGLSQVIDKFKQMKNFFKKILGRLGGFIDDVIKFLRLDKLFSKVGGLIKTLASGAWKFLKKIPILGKAFEGIERIALKFGPKLMKPLAKLGAKFGIKAGLNFAKALPVVGQLIAGVMAVLDFKDGLKDADKIVGKKKELLTLGDKINAGLSSVISGLSFGLIYPKTIYKYLKMIEDAISNGLSTVFNMLPSAMQDTLKKVWEFLFNADKGIFGALPKLLNGVMDQLAGGNYWEAFKSLMMAPIKLALSAFSRLFTNYKDSIMSAFESVKNSVTSTQIYQNYIGPAVDKIVDVVMSMISSMLNVLPDGLKNKFKSVTGKVSDVASSAMNSFKSFIGEGPKDKYDSSVDSIKKLMASGEKGKANEEYKKLLASYAKDSEVQQNAELKGYANNKLQEAYRTVSESPAVVPEAKKNIQATKARATAKQEAPAITVNPVVVPVQQPQKPTTVRRTEGSMDKGLAFANYVGG